MSDLINVLLRPNIESVSKNRPKKDVKIKRLSHQAGEDVIFTLQALPYGKVEDIQNSHSDDKRVDIALAGIAEPNLKDQRLLDKFDAPTPVELLKVMLLPGEIEDLAREVEILTGYRRSTIEEIKKNSKKEPTKN